MEVKWVCHIVRIAGKRLKSTESTCPYCNYELGKAVHTYLPEGTDICFARRMILAIMLPLCFLCVMEYISYRLVTSTVKGGYGFELLWGIRFLALIIITIFEWYWWGDSKE